MIKDSKKLLVFCMTIIMLANTGIPVFAGTGTTSTNGALGSLLDEYTAKGSETFSLTKDSRFFVIASSEPTGELLQTVQLIQRQFAADTSVNFGSLSIVWGKESLAKTGDIVLYLDKNAGIGTEGYKLDVSSTAKVTAGDVDGLLYGANMLQKYFRQAKSTTLSGFTAEDTPDTKQRVVMLDCARKYYTKEWICNFIREMSWMGYNSLELHFSEDGGFRLDLWDEDYYTDGYQPKNDFSWLCGSHVQSWVKDPYRNDPDAGKYLTTKEVIEIIQVAKEYHMDIIPSFDSPAHMDYITWKFEQNYKSNQNYSFTYNGTTYKAANTKGCINYTGRTGDSTPTWPFYTAIDITSGTMARAFVFALYEDIADFFKVYAGSSDFSIGADEVNLSGNYGFKWSYSAFPEYVNSLNRMLNSKGYTCRMFNDFIGSTTYNQTNDGKAKYDFDDNIQIMYWNSDYNPTTGKYDENIWHVWFFWENDNNKKGDWGDGERTMYNCIQTNCYYVLRVASTAKNTDGTAKYNGMDARNPENYNWTFYGSTEADIYNKWYPADISEKGVYSENAADVTENYLGGAYFLIWNDYASLNTEEEVWNGVQDNTGTSTYTYSLLNRMWSNVIKMWNSDANSTVDFNDFEKVRDNYGYFPGYTDCKTAASLPKAVEVTEAKEETVTPDPTPDTGVNCTVTIYCKLKGTETILRTIQYTVTGKKFSAYLSPMLGYEFDSVSGAQYESLQAKDGSGFVVGSITGTEIAIDVWYTYKGDTSWLKDLIGYAPEEKGDYTDDSWDNLRKAKEAAEALKADKAASQEEIDKAANALSEAQTKLVMPSDTTEIISIEKLTDTARIGKKIGLKVTTTPNIAELVVTNEAGTDIVPMVLSVGKIQTLKNKDTVKIWLIDLDTPDTAGEYVYQVKPNETNTTGKTVTVTVQ